MNQLVQRYFSFVKNLIPEPTGMSSVGIDIGRTSCKAVELIKSDNSLKIVNWAIEAIVGEDKAGTIRSILNKMNVESKSIYTAVFGKGTLVRYVTMPRMSKEDLKKSFDLEADRYFPFARDQIYTDCYVLDPRGKDREMSVLVAAAKKEVVDRRIKLLSDLQLQTDFIGMNSVVIANAFSMLGKCDEQESTGNQFRGEDEPSAVAIVDLGEELSNLTILKDNLPAFTRDIFIGGTELSQRISNIMSIKVEEAEKIKCQPGHQSKEILTACDSILINLISEIRRSFDYFSAGKNMPVTKLFLTGGCSMLEDIKELFSKHLEIPIERWNPLSSLKLAQGLDGDEIGKNISRLGVALGLALY